MLAIEESCLECQPPTIVVINIFRVFEIFCSDLTHCSYSFAIIWSQKRGKRLLIQKKVAIIGTLPPSPETSEAFLDLPQASVFFPLSDVVIRFGPFTSTPSNFPPVRPSIYLTPWIQGENWCCFVNLKSITRKENGRKRNSASYYH